MDWQRDGYSISTDRERLDRELIHRFLRSAYWSENVPRAIVDRSIAHSLPFGLYDESGDQVGFARVVTDRAVFAYLGDVFIVEGHRGRGLGRWLVETVLSHPDLRGLRRIALATRDAHGLYDRYGFRPGNSETLMTMDRPAPEIPGPFEAR